MNINKRKYGSVVGPSKPVEIWTVVLTASVLVGGLGKFVFFDWKNSALDQRQKEVAVQKAESEILSLEGKWQPPEVRTILQKTMVSVSPVFIDIKNDGEIPVQIRKIEFKVFTAKLDEVSKLNVYPLDVSKFELGTLVQIDASTRGPTFGFIDPDSSAWQEQASIKLKPISGPIPPGQRRSERRHVIAEPGDASLLTKVEVSVATDKGTYRWYGFSPVSGEVADFYGGASSRGPWSRPPTPELIDAPSPPPEP